MEDQRQSLSQLREAFKEAGFTVTKINTQEHKFKMYKIFDGKVDTGHMLIDQKDGCQVSLFQAPSLRIVFEATFAPIVEKGDNISFGIYVIACIYAKIKQSEPVKPKSNIIGLDGTPLESGKA